MLETIPGAVPFCCGVVVHLELKAIQEDASRRWAQAQDESEA